MSKRIDLIEVYEKKSHKELVELCVKMFCELMKSENVERIERLEKALDKACDELEKHNILVMRFNENDFTCTYETLNKQEWKERFLREVQEDE